MARAIWKDQVIAEGQDLEQVEGNVYFLLSDVKAEFLRPSQLRTLCPWKGECSYFDVVVAGEVNQDAAWTYPEALPAAIQVRGRVAFWKGIKVES